jgi:uncharacterized coiled-coil protein SlyX
VSDSNSKNTPPENTGGNSTTVRISELESLFAHLERQQEQLNAVVIEQGKVITRLQKKLDELNESMMGQEIDRIHATQQKPPHYLP